MLRFVCIRTLLGSCLSVLALQVGACRGGFSSDAQADLQWVSVQGEHASPLVSLKAGDGTDLHLRKMDARVVVHEPLAFTELRLEFENPTERRLEGRFQVVLPSGAAISRFAMVIGEKWQEGEVVEIKAARRAYEDFLHQRQDPALLEQDAGNRFRARVFPIEARGRKKMIVSYSEELSDSSKPYRLPLAGIDEVESLRVAAFAGPKSRRSLVSKRDFDPIKDLELRIKGRAKNAASVLRSGRFVVARIRPKLPKRSQDFSGLTVLLDTSASRALEITETRARLKKLVGALEKKRGASFPLQIVAFDQDVEQIFNGSSGGWLTGKEAALGRDALGATDLFSALEWLSKREKSHDRLLIVTDGILTVRNNERASLAKILASLKATGVKRIDLLRTGGLQDDTTLHELRSHADFFPGGYLAGVRISLPPWRTRFYPPLVGSYLWR